MNLDNILAGLPDDEPVPQPPRIDDLESLDAAFESTDYAIDEAESTFTKRSADDADTILMQLPRGKVAKVSRQRFNACKTDAELRALDKQLYVAAGLDPSAYGL